MVDFRLTSDFELAVDDQGDLASGETTGQIVYLILNSSMGEWRSYPYMGVNAKRLSNSPEGVTTELIRDAALQINSLEGLGLIVEADGNNLVVRQ